MRTRWRRIGQRCFRDVVGRRPAGRWRARGNGRVGRRCRPGWYCRGCSIVAVAVAVVVGGGGVDLLRRWDGRVVGFVGRVRLGIVVALGGRVWAQCDEGVGHRISLN